MHADYSRAVDRAGVTPTLIHAGAHKVDGNPYAPLSGEVKADLQAEVDRYYALNLAPSEIEEWIEQGKVGMENALRSKPEDVREQYEREIKTLQEAYGEAMLELRDMVCAVRMV